VADPEGWIGAADDGDFNAIESYHCLEGNVSYLRRYEIEISRYLADKYLASCL